MMMPDPEDMYHLSRRSVELWRAFHDEERSFEMRNCGCLWLGESAEDWPLLEGIDSKLRGYGDPGMMIDQAALLKQHWENARLKVIADAGHAVTEHGISKALVNCCNEMLDLVT